MKSKVLLIILFFVSITYIAHSQTIIEMERKNGVYYVPCKIKDIPMKFVFDTGASSVSISITEAMFLLKHGGLSFKNIKESTKYKIANGSIQEGTRVIIPSIKVGGIELNNVEAGVVHNMEAPLLLGQSAISKLGDLRLKDNLLIIYNNNEPLTGIDFDKTFDEYGFPVSFNNFKTNNNSSDLGTFKNTIDANSILSDNSFFKTDNFKVKATIYKTGEMYGVSAIKPSLNLDKDFTKYKNKITKKLGVKGEQKKNGFLSWETKNTIVFMGVEKGKSNIMIVVGNRKILTPNNIKTDFLSTPNFYKINFKEQFKDFSFSYTLEDLKNWAKDKSRMDSEGVILKDFDIRHFEKTEDNDFLASINFDEESFKFHSSGLIHSVKLVKKTDDPNRLFEEVKKEIAERYGKSKRISDKTISWTTNKNYFIYLSVTENNVLITVINYVIAYNSYKKNN